MGDFNDSVGHIKFPAQPKAIIVPNPVRINDAQHHLREAKRLMKARELLDISMVPLNIIEDLNSLIAEQVKMANSALAKMVKRI